MKKVAIIPLIMINNDREARLVETDAEIGALVIGILDGHRDGEAGKVSISDLQNISISGNGSSGTHQLPENIVEMLSSVLRRLLDQNGNGNGSGHSHPANGLSPRETEVLRLLAQGNTNKEIAGQLFLSVKTIETHRRNIYRKLKIHNRTQATAYAIRQGIA